MDALKSYKQEDSVKGLITFAMNRISWAGAAEEHKITEHLKLYGQDALDYWFNQYQVEAGKAGALRGGYLSNEVDDDFHRLAQGYEDSMKTLLLVGITANDIQEAMSMARICWKAAREQFKYMLAMNDIIYKAEHQIQYAEEGTEDNTAWKNFNANRPQIEFEQAPGFKVFLSPTAFWEVFTAPSLKAMLHFSVNSFNNKAVAINNPLGEAISKHEA